MGVKVHSEFQMPVFDLAVTEPSYEKNNNLDFRPGLLQTSLYNFRCRIETRNFEFKKKWYCTILLAITKALISCAITALLICVIVFAYADC